MLNLEQAGQTNKQKKRNPGLNNSPECVRQNWSYSKSHGNKLVCFPYIKGTTQENLDKLIQNVQIESDSDMIRNWKYLDVPVISSVRMYLFIL